MKKTVYHIPKMDCPSEENLIRIKLDGLKAIEKLEFDIENRNLIVFHLEGDDEILARLVSLNLGAKRNKSEIIEKFESNSENSSVQSKLLRTVLIINFSFFIVEMTAGFASGSMGLLADSLDMLADALVYGLSLWAVGTAFSRKRKVARFSGYLQLALAVGGLIEVIRRFLGEVNTPNFRVMIAVSVLALIANSICLYLLQKTKSSEVHMKASMIFTSNDVIINSGVIVAGIMVLITQSKYPDLIIGTIVFLIVLRGAVQILKLGNNT